MKPSGKARRGTEEPAAAKAVVVTSVRLTVPEYEQARRIAARQGMSVHALLRASVVAALAA